ncbi:hypothetical protein ACFFLM_04525 [Deinococcus oregonensis]|uniref:Uncharacterized protein n=1 Tax=Deinococcus oregonensis TaxID=1805970 RepID=A0ABV6AUR8_9DEIO
MTEADFLPAYRHASKNLRDRYNLRLTIQGYLELCTFLAEKKHRFILAFSHSRREVLLVNMSGRLVITVFDPEAELIVTFLPSLAYSPPINDRHAQARDRKRRRARRRRNINLTSEGWNG